MDGTAEALPGTLLSGYLRDSPTGAGPGLAPSVDAATDATLQQNFCVVSPGAWAFGLRRSWDSLL